MEISNLVMDQGVQADLREVLSAQIRLNAGMTITTNKPMPQIKRAADFC